MHRAYSIVVPEPGSASSTATRRLQKDYAKLAQDPIDGITALPNDMNILEWHYCLRGSPGTCFDGGYYWGKIVFKPDFPWSPPAIMMITPNGRFETNVRLCLSISDYHPESWNPGWTVSAILVGLHSFMNEKTHAAGVINSSEADCKQYASNSRQYNLKCPEFVKFFPGLVAEWSSESNGISQQSLSSSSSSSSQREITLEPTAPGPSDEPPKKKSKTGDFSTNDAGTSGNNNSKTSNVDQKNAVVLN